NQERCPWHLSSFFPEEQREEPHLVSVSNFRCCPVDRDSFEASAEVLVLRARFCVLADQSAKSALQEVWKCATEQRFVREEKVTSTSSPRPAKVATPCRREANQSANFFSSSRSSPAFPRLPSQVYARSRSERASTSSGLRLRRSVSSVTTVSRSFSL